MQKVVLDTARREVAALLGCHSDEIAFTSGGSEANNLALKGVYFQLRENGEHIITTKIQHTVVTQLSEILAAAG